MKLRDTQGEVCDIVNIMAVDKNGGLWLYNDGYDLINDIGVRLASVPEKTIRLSAGSSKKESTDPNWIKSELQKKDTQIAQLQLSVTSLGERLDQLETTANRFNP
jgi:hypothetical protein